MLHPAEQPPPRSWLVAALARFTADNEGLAARTRARVVLSNPAAEPAHPDLPPGMAVVFEDLDHAYAAVIQRLVEERLAALAV